MIPTSTTARGDVFVSGNLCSTPRPSDLVDEILTMGWLDYERPTAIFGGHCRLIDSSLLTSLCDEALGSFEYQTFEMAMDIYGQFAPGRAQLGVLINDVDGIPSKHELLESSEVVGAYSQFLEQPGVHRDLLDGSAPNPIRKRLFGLIGDFPRSYRTLAAARHLDIESCTISHNGTYFIKETTMRDQMKRILQRAYARTHRSPVEDRIHDVSAPGSTWRDYRPQSGLANSAFASEQQSISFTTAGRAACTAEIAMLVETLASMGYSQMVAFWPDICMPFVCVGTEMACRIFGLDGFRAHHVGFSTDNDLCIERRMSIDTSVSPRYQQ